MAEGRSRFALYFGNRGFFPGPLLKSAREEMTQVLRDLGHETIALDAEATRYGAVETPAEGEIYARFLRENRGRYDGIILSLPNFGDENGAAAALKEADVPILIQAYPDNMSKMSPEFRRDAFCGKISIMDILIQNSIKYTALKPHTVLPQSPEFRANIDHFDRVCRTVSSLKDMRVGAIGARTTAFKTVRIDEVALQKNGITMETFDLSEVFHRMKAINSASDVYKDKEKILKEYADFSSVPSESTDRIVRLGVVIDTLMEECRLDAIAIRCWLEMQQIAGISPCVIMSEMNSRKKIASCEVDVGNAVAMYALSSASGSGAACLDWNNNYNDEEDKCILFHCGPVPQSMMMERGLVTEHAILKASIGSGCSFGCNTGRIRPMQSTFSSMITDAGKLKFFAVEGSFTADPVPDDYFGCAGVAEIPNLQDVLLYIGRNGHRHHVSVTEGHVSDVLREALGHYLGFDVATL